MLKQRRRAAELVAADFLRAEASIDAAATHAAACVTTMLGQRAEARLPVTTGLQALDLISDAAADMIRARRRFVEAHALLVEARAGIGVRAFGDESECPPGYDGNTGYTASAPLAALKAVA